MNIQEHRRQQHLRRVEVARREKVEKCYEELGKILFAEKEFMEKEREKEKEENNAECN